MTSDAVATLVQGGVFVTASAAAAPGAWRRLRSAPAGAVAAVGVLAVCAAASCVWPVPISRYEALGHEASYVDVLTGARPPGADAGWEPYITYPLLRWLYWCVGELGGGVGAGLFLNAVARGVAVAWAGVAGARWTGRPAGGIACAALLLATPQHAFWGASLFNVAVPLAFAWASVAAALAAIRDGDGRALAFAASCGVLMVAGRVEFGLLGPALLALLALGPDRIHPDLRRPAGWGPAVAALAIGAPTLLVGRGQLTEQGGYHDLAGYLGTIARQAGIFGLLDVWGAPWLLLPLGVAAWWQARARGGVAGAAAAFGLLWLGLASFNDFSFRHALLALIPLLLLMAGLTHRRAGAALLAACLLAGGWGFVDLRARYHADGDRFAELPAFRGAPKAAEEVERSGCYLITDNERLWAAGVAGSHFNLMDPGEAVARWRRHGCILWLEDAGSWREDGTVVRSRGLKLRHWFRWRGDGWTQLAEGPVLIWRMTEPPWGVPDDAPAPAPGVRLPWMTDDE